MRRLFAALLSAAILFCLFAPAAAASEAADAARETTFSVSIYNDVTQEYVLENNAFTTSGVTVFRTINLLKSEKLIADFTQAESELLELRYYLLAGADEASLESLPSGAKGTSSAEPERETALLRSNDVDRFYVKRNGTVVTGDALNRYMRDGDIIEWIYGEPPELPPETTSEPESETTPKAPAEYWTEAASSALSAAGGWLNLNPDAGSLYLTALGSAGKTADMKTITNILTSIRGGSSGETAEELAKLVLNLSYCGYDRNDQDMATLMSRLMALPMTSEDGLAARAYTLIAFDSRSYTIPNAVTNNRQALIRELLAFQQADGGFASGSGGVSEVDATALALTALARYRDQSGVSKAVENGLAYLASVQMENGGFKARGQMNSRSVSLVTAALCTLNVNLSDLRFYKGEKTLLDVLLQYAGADGGFSLAAGGSSDGESTQLAVIALSAVKRSGNPYLVPASLTASVPAVAPSVEADVESPETRQVTVYLVIGCGCLAAFVVLLILLIRNLKRPRAEEPPGPDEKDDSKK